MSQQQWNGAPPQQQRGRGAVFGTIRVLTSVWAVFMAFVFVVAIFDPPPDPVTHVFGLFFLALWGFGPLGLHLWWGRRNPVASSQHVPIQAPAGPVHQPAGYPLHTPMGRLERIADAAQQLRVRGWIEEHDHRAITERAQRLTDLALADQQSVSLGGAVSPTVGHEIEALHRRVIGILDAAIDSAAVAPGDADLDERLQRHVDRLHSHGQAVGEVEGRWPQPGLG